MSTIIIYVGCFILYSCIGWLGEVLYVRATEGKWVDRGFLKGPFFLTYGVGALLPAVLFTPQSPAWSVMLLGVIYATSVEWASGMILRSVGISYWDYSHKLGNISGLTCLESAMVFMVAIGAEVYYIQPSLVTMLMSVNEQVRVGATLAIGSYILVALPYRLMRQWAIFKQTGRIRNHAYDQAS